jgi:hypothetical protein
MVLAYEAVRDGFWLSRWLIAREMRGAYLSFGQYFGLARMQAAQPDRLDAAG